MKKYLLLIALFFSVGASFAVTRGDEHLKGYIDDSMCAGSATPMCTAATRANCAAKCIKGGAKAVLVVDGKVYKITNQKAVLKYAGKNVTVDGEVTDDTIKITKVTEVTS